MNVLVILVLEWLVLFFQRYKVQFYSFLYSNSREMSCKCFPNCQYVYIFRGNSCCYWMFLMSCIPPVVSMPRVRESIMIKVGISYCLCSNLKKTISRIAQVRKCNYKSLRSLESCGITIQLD